MSRDAAAIVITGLGAVSSLGRGVARVWSAMAEGWDGLGPIHRFDARSFGVEIAGVVPDRNAPGGAASGPDGCAELAIDAAREAWRHAALDGVPRDRVAVVFGSSLGDRDVTSDDLAARIGDALGVTGPRIAVTTACASTTNALGLARDLLELGAADVVLAGGADVLTPLVLAGFRALGVLAAGKCAPFSEPAGTTLAEGAGFVVLERATGRARPLAGLLGYGLSADGVHDTGPDPSGAGVARAMRGALADAGVASDAIDYVNAHGTGTLANDPAEWRAIGQVFGARADTLPVSSSKSFLGHAQGAAGVLELIATVVAMNRGVLPPTQRYTVARPNSPRDPVAGAIARPARCEIAISNSAGFGGANCSVVIARAPRTHAVARRQIAIAGTALIETREGPLPAAIDPRGLDPTTRMLIGAAARAIDLAPRASDRCGFVVGQRAASPDSIAALQATIDRHGYRGMSANLFARQVANAAAGTTARLLGLRGAHSVVGAGSATGLVAALYAAELLATRDDLDRVVAAAVDEAAGTVGDAPALAGTHDGAASALLVAGAGTVEVAGWGLAGPGRLDDAIENALAIAGLARSDCAIDREPTVSPSASAALAALVVAAARVAAGELDRVVVARSGGACADAAVVLCRGDRHAT